jgi:protein tyrosine/serine phosphatase
VNRKLKQAAKILLLATLLLVTGTGAYAVYLVAEHNLHVVAAGQIYRSSRMSSEALAEVVQTHGLKSVLTLIGTNRAEGETLQRLGAEYFVFSLSDRHEVTDEQMEKILATIRRAPKPLLIHCKAGADRTGLVAALYHYGIEGQPAAVADGELTVGYGHLPAGLGLGTSAMDRSFWRYVGSHAPGSATNSP